MAKLPCKVATCDRPKMKGKHFCVWHWLARQSSDIQASAARARLATKTPEEHVARVAKDQCPDGERWCAGCQSFVPLFYCSGSRCKACVSMAAHERRLEATYGIPADEYARILKVQGGRCAICRSVPRTIRLAVDHDHKTGAVRGLLCKRCNNDLLGGGHDSVELLWTAIKYLLNPPASPTDVEPTLEQYLARLEWYLTSPESPQERPKPAARPDPVDAPF
jgi:hypothetical protein